MDERPLRVFFNASALPPRPAGAGVYTIELGRALARDRAIELVAAAPAPHDFGPLTIPTPAGRRRHAWQAFSLARALGRASADVYHGPHFFVPRSDLPSVATVHDLTFFRMPARYGLLHRRYYRYLARTARRAGRIIVPTAVVAGEVIRYLGYPPERIRVVPEAPREGLAPALPAAVAAVRAELALNAPYLLCLGTAEPGKRAVDAIRALPAIRERAPGTLLALAGNPGRLSAPLEREAARLGVVDAVRFLGYVADEQLAPLLTGAAALLFPSLYEGFGLPPLEAMACGTPVVSADAPAMREVLGDAAIFVGRKDPAALAREATRLIESPSLHHEFAARGRERAARFSWAHAAAETVSVYREVAR